MKTPKRLSMNFKGEIPFEGNSIEQEMRIATATKTPIQNNQMSNCFYTQRKDGVLKECDIRTDRFEVAQNAREHINQQFRQRIKEKMEQQEPKQQEPKAE